MLQRPSQGKSPLLASGEERCFRAQGSRLTPVPLTSAGEFVCFVCRADIKRGKGNLRDTDLFLFTGCLHLKLIHPLIVTL